MSHISMVNPTNCSNFIDKLFDRLTCFCPPKNEFEIETNYTRPESILAISELKPNIHSSIASDRLKGKKASSLYMELKLIKIKFY
jgi:hypothetical protein